MASRFSPSARLRRRFNALATNWAICEDTAKDNGQTVDRSGWRLVGPVHIAETREKARENVRFGLDKWLYYFREVAALPLAPTDGSDPVDALIASGMAVVGTPDDAIAQIERLQAQSGGFGCFMQLAHNWANWENTKRSYELMARYVFPKFQNLNDNREVSLNWAKDNRQSFMGQAMMAVGARVAQHVEKKGTENIRPENPRRHGPRQEEGRRAVNAAFSNTKRAAHGAALFIRIGAPVRAGFRRRRCARKALRRPARNARRRGSGNRSDP